jgi:hypothetical protein
MYLLTVKEIGGGHRLLGVYRDPRLAQRAFMETPAPLPDSQIVLSVIREDHVDREPSLSDNFGSVEKIKEYQPRLSPAEA